MSKHGAQREYIIEMQRLGNAMKVCACDPITGREVSIVGAAGAPPYLLKRNAVRKLEFVLGKEKPKPRPGVLV